MPLFCRPFSRRQQEDVILKGPHTEIISTNKPRARKGATGGSGWAKSLREGGAFAKEESRQGKGEVNFLGPLIHIFAGTEGVEIPHLGAPAWRKLIFGTFSFFSR